VLKRYKIVILVILICTIGVACSNQDHKREETPTISIHSDSDYVNTFDDLNLGVLFDFDFYMPNADERWVTLWVEKYVEGEKDSQSLAELSYGNSPAKTEDNITVSNDPMQCGAVVDYPDSIVSDDCPAGFTAVCTPESGTFFPVGTTTVTCTVTDPCGGFVECSFDVTVEDTEPPSITCSDDITVFNDPGTCGAIVPYPDPVVSDNCPGATVVCSPASGSFFPLGTTTVTCTATDAAGNTSTCSFNVRVIIDSL
jgi:hypothetical protein